MKNYWLSEYNNHQEAKNQKMNDDDYEDEDEEESGHSLKDSLTDRQKLMYEHYEHIVEEFGPFNKSGKANGAHYAPAKQNPFKKAGMICSNCVFYQKEQACEIVSGTIEPQAICKLWIIPQDLIKE